MKPPSFSDSALDRIAQCYDTSVTIGDGDRQPTDLLGLVARLADEGRDEASMSFAWPHTVANLLGMMELGVVAGHVDLATWRGRPATLLRTLLRELLAIGERDTVNFFPTDGWTLARRFVDRLGDRAPQPTSVDPAVFAAFESYLDLTSVVERDAPCRRFLDETRDGVVPAADVAFLLSPRHFADALRTGKVGAVAAGEVAGGLAALRHFDWLARILDDVADAPSFRGDLTLHAVWSHGAWGVSQRVSRWAEHMRDWPGAEQDASAHDASERDPWVAYRRRVLLPLTRAQLDVGILPSSTEFDAATATDMLDDHDAAFRFAAEGRLGAARRRQRAFVEAQRATFEAAETSTQHREQAAYWIVKGCEELVEMGDLDSAAAYLAPMLDRLAGRSIEGDFSERAAAVVARARRQADGPTPLADTPTASVRPASEAHARRRSMEAD